MGSISWDMYYPKEIPTKSYPTRSYIQYTYLWLLINDSGGPSPLVLHFSPTCEIDCAVANGCDCAGANGCDRAADLVFLRFAELWGI